MTPQDLIKQSKSICEAATPGPWAYDGVSEVFDWSELEPEDPERDSVAKLSWPERDGIFIATARTLVPELAAALSESQVRVVELEHFLASARETNAGHSADMKFLNDTVIHPEREKLKRERDEARELLKVLQGRHQIASIAVASGLNPDATLDELYEHLAELRDG